jgi:hypothetical protein
LCLPGGEGKSWTDGVWKDDHWVFGFPAQFHWPVVFCPVVYCGKSDLSQNQRGERRQCKLN